MPSSYTTFERKVSSLPIKEITLPTGPLQIAFTGSFRGYYFPSISKIANTSPLIGKVERGYVAEKLILPKESAEDDEDEDTIFENLDVKELIGLLCETATIPGRRLIMRMGYPEEIILRIPYRERNKFLIAAGEKDKPICMGMKDGKLNNIIRKGMMVYYIKYAICKYSILKGTASEMRNAMMDARVQEDRLIVLKPPTYYHGKPCKIENKPDNYNLTLNKITRPMTTMISKRNSSNRRIHARNNNTIDKRNYYDDDDDEYDVDEEYGDSDEEEQEPSLTWY